MKIAMPKTNAREEAAPATAIQLIKKYHSALSVRQEELTRKIKYADIVVVKKYEYRTAFQTIKQG